MTALFVPTISAGWLWLYLSLKVVAPAAIESSWLPRQMPKIGLPRAIAFLMFEIVAVHCCGSPGPLESITPS